MFGTNKAFVVVVDDVLCFPQAVPEEILGITITVRSVFLVRTISRLDFCNQS